MTTQATVCEHCGKPLNHRPTTRGRRRRFCNDACRAAASRERKKREHAAQLAQAREQLSLDLYPDREITEDDVVEQINTLTAALHTTDTPCHEHHELLDAAHRLLDTARQHGWDG